jgi:hypothetical protein
LRPRAASPAILEAPLATPHRARRAAERSGDIRLRGPTLLDETDHRVRLGHGIAEGVVRDGHAGDGDNAVVIDGSQQATRVDRDGTRVGGRVEQTTLGRLRHVGSLPRGAEKSGQVWVRTLPGPDAAITRGCGCLCQEVWNHAVGASADARVKTVGRTWCAGRVPG